jgi:AMMECR1 domain-containing protein
MGLQNKNIQFVRYGKQLVFLAAGLAFFAASCGQKSEGGKASVAGSALIPRKSVTLRVTGDTLVTGAQQDSLLALARRTIAGFMRTGSVPPPSLVNDSTFLKNRGCLIKLTVDSMIRGTSGYILPVKPLAAAVAELSMRAATGGQRYDSLKPQELDRTVIQISVVSEPVTIKNEAEVKVQQHGLVLKYEGAVAGIMLVDDVAQSSSAGDAIERLLNLNRMTKKDWVPPKVEIQTFTVQVFQESK